MSLDDLVRALARGTWEITIRSRPAARPPDWIAAAEAGVFWPLVVVGQRVAVGEVVGTVDETALTSPLARRVAALLAEPGPVVAGQALVLLDPAEAGP